MHTIACGGAGGAPLGPPGQGFGNFCLSGPWWEVVTEEHLCGPVLRAFQGGYFYPSSGQPVHLGD